MTTSPFASGEAHASGEGMTSGTLSHLSLHRDTVLQRQVYIHFKVWTNGFRILPVADTSFAQASVYEWKLGEATDRIPKGAAEAAIGMREGGWRRMVIPAAQAYGEAGLLVPARGGKLSKAVYAVPPNTAVYFDLRVVDGGSGKCEALLHPPGMPDKQAKRLGSLTCVRGAP